MSNRQRFSVLFSQQAVMLFFGCLFLIHVAFLSFFAREYNQNRQALRGSNIVQNIQNVLNASQLEVGKTEQDTFALRRSVVNKSQYNDIKYSLTRAPKGNKVIRNWTPGAVRRVVSGHLLDFNVSVMVAKEQWLNAKSEVKTRFFYQELFLIITEIVVFSCIFISAWSVSRFTRPLRKFKVAAERLGVDLHAAPLDLYGPKVVRETAFAMNRMQNRIQDLIRDRTQMIAAISHDLRTPITRMKLRLQLLDDQSGTAACIQDLDEMNEMIKAVMDFSRDDAEKEPMMRIELASLVETICNDAVDMGHLLTFQGHVQRVPVMGRSLDLKRAFTNVINNACRYGTRVSVDLSVVSRQARILIKDDGPGIPEDEIERVFEPFYRAEKSRNRDTGGVGLGLAVTEGIIHAHEGKIRLRNVKPSGLLVTIMLPCLN